MSGALFQLDVNTQPIVQAQRRLGRLDDAIDRDLAAALAEVMLQQTRRRILVEKRAPDGTPWAPWSREYAMTRVAGDSLLVHSHDLEQSLQASANGREAQVLASTIYAAVHQYGFRPRNIPARPYLGVSEENALELADAARAVLEDAIDELTTSARTRHGRAIDARGGGRIV